MFRVEVKLCFGMLYDSLVRIVPGVPRAAGGWQLAVGGCWLAVGGRRLVVGGGRLAVGSWRLAAGVYTPWPRILGQIEMQIRSRQ